ncbi:MAG: hypothetical protein ACOY3Z_05210 [Thermodesulfobacteriota bacterium]
MLSTKSLGLSGLKSVLNIQTPTEPTSASPIGGSTNPQLGNILKAKEDSVRVSESAKDLGETYKRLKASGNQEAVSGFTKVVQGFGSGISGEAISNVATATSKMSDTDLQQYGSVAKAVSSQGNSAVLAKFAGQAATAYNADKELGRGYMNATSSIMNAEYSGNRQEVASQKLATQSNFMTKFGELGSPSKASKEDVASFTSLANSIGGMGKGTEINTAIRDYTMPSKVAAIA